MVINSSRPFWAILIGLWLPMLPIVAYVLAISWADLQFHLEEYNFPLPIVTVVGTVIGLVLAFRTNSSYARWWEARTLWGAIVNDSRSWVRQLLEFTHAESEQKAILRQMAYRQVAWCYALSRSLRGQDPIIDLMNLIPAGEIESYRASQNVPNDLLLRQSKELRSLADCGSLQVYQLVELERTLVRLTNSMGGCERIKNTPFPSTYGKMVHGMIYVFVFFLPFGLFNVPSPALVLTSLSLSYGFLLIDRVAMFLQDPFSNRPSDTPMLALSRTIEINIRQMLGETDLPEKKQPVAGVLY